MPDFKPIVQWPGTRTPANKRQRGPFGVTYPKIIRDLEAEIRHLKGDTVVIQAECADADIRLDGHLRGNAKLRGPGIIVSFNSRHGPLSFACDTYTDWQQNLRAISQTLWSLRAVDRYGATKHAEQYKGWKQLPEGGGETAQDAADVLVLYGGGSTREILAYHDAFVKAFRNAAKATHPDTTHGSAEAFRRVQAAKLVLEAHHASRGVAHAQ